MDRPKPPNTEDCSGEEVVDLLYFRTQRQRRLRSASPGKREPQAGAASGLSDTASKPLEAGEHNGRFDFLGFEFYWEPDRQGKPRVKRRTASKKLRASVQRMTEWIKTNRHNRQQRIMRTLRAKLQGTWNYYGLIGNSRRMGQFYCETCRTVFKWLNRRSQRKSLTWKAFNNLMSDQ